MSELTLTERRVATLAAAGRSDSDIAAALGLDEQAVRWQLARALRKLEQAARLHDRLARRRSR